MGSTIPGKNEEYSENRSQENHLASGLEGHHYTAGHSINRKIKEPEGKDWGEGTIVHTMCPLMVSVSAYVELGYVLNLFSKEKRANQL